MEAMLVLTRKLHEEIIIDGGIRVSVLRIEGNRVRIGVSAPSELSIRRLEVPERSLERRHEESLASGG
jgi:carbon storage regulator